MSDVLATTHFDKSILNNNADWNAVQSFNNNNRDKDKDIKRQEKIYTKFQKYVSNVNVYCIMDKLALTIESYVLFLIISTRETAHIDMSLLNFDAWENAI